MTAEPSADSSGAAAVNPLDRAMAEVGRWFVGTLVLLLWSAALLVGWRRLAVPLRPPGPPVLLSVGALLVALAAGLRIGWHRLSSAQKPSQLDWLMAILPTAAVLALGAALSLPGTDIGALVAFWGLLIGEELWAWRPGVWRRLFRGGKAAAARPLPVGPAQTPSPHPKLSTIADDVPGDDVLQQLIRSQAADGGEQLSGWLRTPFSAGQRTASVHVVFCPQFPKTPEMTVEQLDGPEVLRINKTVFSFGARLDLKLAAPAEKPSDVLLQFSARSKPPAGPTTAR